MKRVIITLILASLIIQFSSCKETEKQPSRITGTLVNAEGQPVQDEDIYLLPPSRLMRTTPIQTNEKGEFNFDNLPAGDYVIAYGSDYNQGQWITVNANENKVIQLTLKDNPYLMISGHIKADGYDLQSCKINFAPLNPEPSRLTWPARNYNTSISKDGHYEISHIPSGQYLVAIVRIPDENEKTTNQENNLKKPFTNYITTITIDQSKTYDITFEQNSLEGTILNHESKPVKYAQLFLSPTQLTAGWIPGSMALNLFSGTDKDGHYQFDMVDTGSYDMVLFNSQTGTFLKENIQITQNKNTLDWQLEKPVSIERNIICTEKDNIPNMMFISNHNSKLMSIYDASSKSIDGNLRSPPMKCPPGEYTVLLMDKVFGRSVEAFKKTIDSDTKITARLEDAGEIKVILKGAPKDISGEKIFLYDSDGDLIPRLYDPKWLGCYDYMFAVILPTTREGITYISSVKPGNYLLATEGQIKKVPCTVSKDQVTTVTITVNH